MTDDLVKKYELTSDSINVAGRTLYRVEAVRDFANVRRGEKGGFVESEAILSQSGNAWVYGNARVCDNARVSGDARVCDNARVSGNAWVCDNALVSSNARVCGHALVCDNARVYGDARVCDNALVSGNARVYGNARICDNARVYGDARVSRQICAATRSDGYTFIVASDSCGELRLISGCRYFSFDEARTHWIATLGGTPLGDETMQILDHLEAMAKIRQGKMSKYTKQHHTMSGAKKIEVETPTCLECFSTDVELKYRPEVEDIGVMWLCPVAVCLQCGEESDQPEAGQFLDELYSTLKELDKDGDA